MTDSRAKGVRGEYIVRDLLRAYTDLQFERVPSSGALAYLKGDLYVPGRLNKYCIEVKNYATTPLCDKIFTQEKTNKLTLWWNKLLLQAKNGNQLPLLFFRYNRSKIFVVTHSEPEILDKYMYISWLGCYVMLAEEWLGVENITFVV